MCEIGNISGVWMNLCPWKYYTIESEKLSASWSCSGCDLKFHAENTKTKYGNIVKTNSNVCGYGIQEEGKRRLENSEQESSGKHPTHFSFAGTSCAGPPISRHPHES